LKEELTPRFIFKLFKKIVLKAKTAVKNVSMKTKEYTMIEPFLFI